MPHRWIRLLGLVPSRIGIKQLIKAWRTEPEQPRTSSFSAASIALLTLSNGADNIGVYVPFFPISRAHLVLILIAYAVLVAVWCFTGRRLGNRQ